MTEMDACTREECGHIRRHHRDLADDRRCRVTGCSCPAFVEAAAEAGTARRRVVFDIPDGYAAVVTLHRIDTNHAGDDDGT